MAELRQDPTSGADDDDALLEALGGEEEEADEEVEEAAPGGGFMTAQQVQELLNNQTQMIAQTLGQANRRQPERPQEPQESHARQVMPTAQEVRQAFENGDPDQFIDVYNRGLQAVYQASEERIQALERNGAQRIQQLAQETARGVVPDEYRDTVNSIMDEFGLAPELRTNRQILQVLTDAAKGRNMDREVNRAIEARMRQATQKRQGAEPTSSRRPQDQEAEEPIFNMAAIQALRNAGRSPDQHAQQLGYKNWDDYVQATSEKYDNWQERSVPAWRRRLNERRQATGRRAN